MKPAIVAGMIKKQLFGQKKEEPADATTGRSSAGNITNASDEAGRILVAGNAGNSVSPPLDVPAPDSANRKEAQCPEGCYWVAPNKCSRCFPELDMSRLGNLDFDVGI